MKRKNTMRNALVTSIISMLLCVSMLVGTTFAWFTDEVVSGRNTIAAGNLDIELLADGNKVDNNTVLFDNERLWEPGAVVYENLQIANVGTLALKYQLTLDVFAENDLNGCKLSEVVKIALVDEIQAGATREEVLAAAKASKYVGDLSNFYLTGSLEAGKSTDVASVVVFWEPTDHDNDYNANNGQKTSDGKPLFIEFGINLQATQLMHEEDSFGPDYDEAATIMPKAKVTNLGARKITATTSFPNGNDPKEYNAPFLLKFEPNESYDEALAGEYALYHADFVVKADRDVSGNSMALAGYYSAACDGFNNGNWVAMTTDQTIAANTDVRLVSNMGVTVNYSEICNYGNDGKGFQCTAIDLTGANAGTTVTVELRMFKVPAKGECANGGGCNHPSVDCETGESYLIGTYTYTFPAVQVDTVDELKAALKAGTTLIDAKGAEIGMLNYGLTKALIPEGKTVTIKNAKVGPGASYGNQVDGTVIFENCTFDADVYSIHFDGGKGKVIFNDCTLKGWCSFGSVEVEMNNCDISGNGKYALVRCYKDAVFNNCTFDLSDADRTDRYADRVDCGSANPSNTIVLNSCTNVNGAMADIVPADIVALGKIIIK